jgi:hypothetical protein
MTVAQVADSTTASDMALTGLCPAIGQGWMFFMPAAADTQDADGVSEGVGMTKEEVTQLAAAVDAMAASDAAMASDFHWADQLQGCNDVVLDATVPMKIELAACPHTDVTVGL